MPELMGVRTVSLGLIERHTAWTPELMGITTALRLVLEIPAALMIGLPLMT
jgi:hypothetical protein